MFLGKCVILRSTTMDESPRPLRRIWSRAALPALAALLVVAVVAIGAFQWASGYALGAAHASGEQTARAHLGRLASELQKFRLLPLVLSEYPDVATALERPDATAIGRLNEKLELLAERTDAAVIYVIGRDGRTIAASNWRLATSFVGQDYGFRPYFRDAMEVGSAELFALGTVSGRPGLFIARGIGPAGARTGVIVVKVEFDAVEAEWARAAPITYVTDRNGVVIIASRPEWRFRTTRHLDPTIQARAREAVQYGREPLQSLPVDAEGHVRRVDREKSFVENAFPAPIDDGMLHVLEPLGPARDSARAVAWAIVMATALLVLTLLVGLLRTRERRLLEREAQAALEREVALRTAELREANEHLTWESGEREAADRRYRAAREELAQANRLSSIGQIAAGVAHEINQPVAAIRSFADNGAKLIERNQPEAAKENLTRIADLTTRIGAITGELRSFARRRPPKLGPVPLQAAIDGALLLIGDTLRTAGIKIEREGDETIEVAGDRIRLEQVLINLLQNCVDALAGRPNPRVRISVMNGADVGVEVADNGPGVDGALAGELFTPFSTGREDGLGLGLAIARNIASDLGGDLAHVPSPLGGAAFRLSLRRA